MGILTKALLSSSSGTKKASKSKKNTWNAKCPIFLGNFTPKTSHSCLKLWYTMFSRQLLFLDDFRFSHITALLLTQVSFGVFFFSKNLNSNWVQKGPPCFFICPLQWQWAISGKFFEEASLWILWSRCSTSKVSPPNLPKRTTTCFGCWCFSAPGPRG